MGNKVVKGYSITSEAYQAVGHDKNWRLYEAAKESNSALVSLFVLKKKKLKREERDETVLQAKREVAGLAKIRHPGVLALIEPLVQTEQMLAFVTERVLHSLGNIIESNKLREYMASELEIKLALYPVLQAVQFLHQSMRQAHLGISPQCLFLSQNQQWKLSGLAFAQLLPKTELVPITHRIADLTFASPETALLRQFNAKSDVYSFGVLILSVLAALQATPFSLSGIDKSYEQQHRGLQSHPCIGKSKKPKELQQFVNGSLSWGSGGRMSVQDLLACGWMNDAPVMTVKQLDRISEYDQQQQLNFLKGLAEVLHEFDGKTNEKVILPKLTELLKFPYLASNIIYIMLDGLRRKSISPEWFRKTCWPEVKLLTKGKQLTAHAIYLLVLNLSHLDRCLGEPEVSKQILPLYLRCFDSHAKLKRLALSRTGKIAKRVAIEYLRTKIIPKIIALLKDEDSEVRKDSLRAIYLLTHFFDPSSACAQIIPALEALRKMGSDVLTNAISNAIYTKVTSGLPTDLIVTKVLPMLIQSFAEVSLSKSDFRLQKNTILGMINRIEREREGSWPSGTPVEQYLYGEADFGFKQETEELPPLKPNYGFLEQARLLDRRICNPQDNPQTANHFQVEALKSSKPTAGYNAQSINTTSPVSDLQHMQYKFDPVVKIEQIRSLPIGFPEPVNVINSRNESGGQLSVVKSTNIINNRLFFEFSMPAEPRNADDPFAGLEPLAKIGGRQDLI